ncbi:DUF4097 family beta strand repeat protein [Streptomyces samsunensis]|uniref:DUF4097 family beta strand repeat-containing protein n=1 Tax=Streptomyces malaysiensis TaxID=92644 RepID=UPI001584200B|nr:DUF4097 family beta strand repeat-containing protein [Streptomyces samsunensis]NUH42901.1 DUF4097 family beta strand repeat protein [Streptomyces samsunensis]
MVHRSTLTPDMRDELAADFMHEFGVSENTATMATGLLLTIASSTTEDQVEPEFQQAIVQSHERGESWAAEFVQAMIAKRLPGYRDTYQRAITTGHDPAAELVREHLLPAATAAEVVTLLAGESIPATTAADDRQDQREAPAGRPYLADVTCPSGTVKVTVDATATIPSATVRTDDKTGPSADAVARSTVFLEGDRLIVHVPDVEGVGGVTQIINRSGGTTRIYQSAGTVYGSVTGVRIVNGNVIVGDVNGASSSIEVLVTLPAGSGVKVDSHNAHLEVNGPIAALRMDTHNGHVRAGIVGRAKIDGHNGNYTFDAIQESVDIDSHNGHTTIGSYSGSDARVTTHNGSLNLAATPQATDRIEAHTHNGSITLRGVRGRQDLDVRTSTHNGSVHKI